MSCSHTFTVVFHSQPVHFRDIGYPNASDVHSKFKGFFVFTLGPRRDHATVVVFYSEQCVPSNLHTLSLIQYNELYTVLHLNIGLAALLLVSSIKHNDVTQKAF
jgi:hypothetical protein